MNPTELPSLARLKSEAKALRRAQTALTHSMALERIAHRYGLRDWNTLAALARRNGPESPVIVGQRVRGAYLGQDFAGEVIGLAKLSDGTRYRVTLQFDDAVDVVTSAHFSNFRRRVTCEIGSEGLSHARCSNGQPHLRLQV